VRPHEFTHTHTVRQEDVAPISLYCTSRSLSIAQPGRWVTWMWLLSPFHIPVSFSCVTDRLHTPFPPYIYLSLCVCVYVFSFAHPGLRFRRQNDGGDVDVSGLLLPSRFQCFLLLSCLRDCSRHNSRSLCLALLLPHIPVSIKEGTNGVTSTCPPTVSPLSLSAVSFFTSRFPLFPLSVRV
jgi:hypothetical protein